MARSPILALGALILAACAQHAEVGPDQVGPGYVTGGGEWSTGGGITVAVRAEERSGVTVICGAWATDRQSALSIYLNDDVIEAGSITLDGRRAVLNLGFMPRARALATLDGAPAACVASSLAWQPGFAAAEPVVRLPRMVFVLDSTDPDPLIFRPGPRAALTP